ncbi:hypothetical protein [Oligoflexus tunisiensis]|uniref:hypothetical protein n=1 Tax=Oligoflexus tunisiensis TaxID=708132 RepID=UPI00114CBF84|nr:hypothetical protein [Oligoflexus tunisiensis]
MRQLILIVLMLISTNALGRPQAADLFCQAFPNSPSCTGSVISCTFCHKGQPPALNSFGGCFKAGVSQTVQEFPTTVEDLQTAIAAVGQEDCDLDGFANLLEIEAGHLPGDEHNRPTTNGCQNTSTQLVNNQWSVCQRDPGYVYKKIWLDVCGENPDYDDYKSFLALSREQQDKALDEQLDDCMESRHWRGKDGVVWQIGHYKIRPVGSVKSGEDAGVVPIVDYYSDFHLFVYSQIDGHDARDQLLANYTVTRTETGSTVTYTKVTPQRLIDGQVMQPDKRVGLLTSFWNLSFYLNYTGIARVLVAQAFNAYLGVSLVNMQGLTTPDPALSQFKDYDSKGVTRPECAQCHAAIDPLTYPFRNYNGLTGTTAVLQGQNATALQNIENLGDERNLTPLSYALPRMEYLDQQFPGIKAMPEAGYIFGKRVENLREWAQVMVESDLFAANTVRDYWRVLVGHEPRTEENAEFEKLWRDFKTVHNYNVKAMLHDLIKTEAYSVP